MIGDTIGHYQVHEKICAGGMEVVYRAGDTKQGQDVAIKVLPEGFTADAERMARFEREARILASLHHPDIHSNYGIEESGSARALVMELVQGPAMADRIRQGAVPLEEDLPVARQIADSSDILLPVLAHSLLSRKNGVQDALRP